MKKQKRTYLQMQEEEATLSSGRYNTDFIQVEAAPEAPSTLLDCYRKALVSFGALTPEGALAEAASGQPASSN